MRQGIVAGLVAGVLLPLVYATSASAILTVTPPVAAPGDVVTVAATGFSSAVGVSPVRIRLSKHDGQILKSAAPDSAGRFTTTFPVPPSLAPGVYLIIGTQTNDSNGQLDITKANFQGTERSFTPSRTVLRVRARAAGRAVAAPPSGGDGGPGGPLGLPVLALMVVPGLFFVAVARTARRRWTLNRPQLGH